MKIIDLLEKQIASLRERVNVTVALAVDNSEHGDERRYRHLDEDGNPLVIEHNEIVNTVSKALPALMQMVVDGKLSKKGTVVIYNSLNELNVVGSLDLKTDTFKVITIMRKKDFKPKRGDKKITV